MRVRKAAAILGLTTPLVVLACGDDESDDTGTGGSGGQGGSGGSTAGKGGQGGKGGTSGEAGDTSVGSGGDPTGEGGGGSSAGGSGGDSSDAGAGGDSGSAGAGSSDPECGDGTIEAGEFCFGAPTEEYEGAAADVAIGSWDAGGTPDVLVANTGAVDLLANDGSGSLASATDVATLGAATVIAVGQLDSGANTDAIVSDAAQTAQVGFGNGTGSTVIVESAMVFEGTIANLYVADIAGSESDDYVLTSSDCTTVVITSDTEGEGHVDASATNCNYAAIDGVFAFLGPSGEFEDHLVLSDGEGVTPLILNHTPGEPSSLGFEAGTTVTMPEATSQMDVGDLNGDGFDDVVITANDSTNLYVLFADGAGNFSVITGSDQYLPVPIDDMAQTQGDVKIGDFNGDGNPDIAVTLTSLDSVAIVLGDGEGGLGPVELIDLGTGTAPTRLDVGDLNDDGIDDLVVVAPGTGQVLTVLSDP